MNMQEEAPRSVEMLCLQVRRSSRSLWFSFQKTGGGPINQRQSRRRSPLQRSLKQSLESEEPPPY